MTMAMAQRERDMVARERDMVGRERDMAGRERDMADRERGLAEVRQEMLTWVQNQQTEGPCARCLPGPDRGGVEEMGPC